MVAASHFDLTGKRVFVAGHNGMVGAAIVRRLGREACTVVTAPRAQLDLREQAQVRDWMAAQRPDVVVVAAAGFWPTTAIRPISCTRT